MNENTIGGGDSPIADKCDGWNAINCKSGKPTEAPQYSDSTRSPDSEMALRAPDVENDSGVGAVQQSEHLSAVGGLGAGLDHSSHPFFKPGDFQGRLFDWLAEFAGSTARELDQACWSSSRPYRPPTWIAKKPGGKGKRPIEPHWSKTDLVRRSHKVAAKILNPILLSRTPAAYGVGNRTRMKALLAIAGAKYVLRVDIEKFFDFIRPWHVRHALKTELGESDERLVRLFFSL